eukprot:287833-Amphidinium_carterae.1
MVANRRAYVDLKLEETNNIHGYRFWAGLLLQQPRADVINPLTSNSSTYTLCASHAASALSTSETVLPATMFGVGLSKR